MGLFHTMLCHLTIFCRHVDQFELVEELYHGKTSTLHEAQHRASGLHVAIKQYKKSHLTPLSK